MAERHLVATVRWRVPERISLTHLNLATRQLEQHEREARGFAGYVANCTAFEGWPIAVELHVVEPTESEAQSLAWVERGDPAFVGSIVGQDTQEGV